jgi:hypothetical protein
MKSTDANNHRIFKTDQLQLEEKALSIQIHQKDMLTTFSNDVLRARKQASKQALVNT